MFLAIFEAPMIRPWLSRMGEMERDTSRRTPSFDDILLFENSAAKLAVD